jgi:hypothetical protein
VGNIRFFFAASLDGYIADRKEALSFSMRLKTTKMMRRRATMTGTKHSSPTLARS